MITKYQAWYLYALYVLIHLIFTTILKVKYHFHEDFTYPRLYCKQQDPESSSGLTSYHITPDHTLCKKTCDPDCHDFPTWILHPQSTGRLTVASYVPCISISLPLLILLSPLENLFPLSVCFFLNHILHLMLSFRWIFSMKYSKTILATVISPFSEHLLLYA